MTTSGGGAGRGKSARKRGGSGSEKPPSGAGAKGMTFGRRPQRLDPSLLASSVIAIPLLEEIERNLAIADNLQPKDPAIGEHNRFAIVIDPRFPGGAEAALQDLSEQLAGIIERAGPGAAATITSPSPLQRGEFLLAFATLGGGMADYILRMVQAERLPSVLDLSPRNYDVIIDVNLDFKSPAAADEANPVASVDAESADPRGPARQRIRDYVVRAMESLEVDDKDQGVDEQKTNLSKQYVFARLSGAVIKKLVDIDMDESQILDSQQTGNVQLPARSRSLGFRKAGSGRFKVIHHIWPDFAIHSCLTSSISTVKADAAQRAFCASGEGITWGVMDSGIHAEHPHFQKHQNIDPTSTYHQDFTGSPGDPQPLQDAYGHGTHVAGIIAGEQSLDFPGVKPEQLVAVGQELSTSGRSETRPYQLEQITSIAPQCKLVSLKVLDEFGMGKASNVIAAIAYVHSLNSNGRDLKIHGVNLSLGYSFDPKWFACGHSPLCVEVNRLVKSGVVVVVAAGNSGYGTITTKEGSSDACLDLTINDPGNAEHVITVGSTHRDMPHMYGVSFFSSKGPTGDGRFKPDLLAPGEKIISCAAPDSNLVADLSAGTACAYIEQSGTSMAAPHVSGAIAAFLSIRREHIGEAERVKKIFMASAIDLGRSRYFQGAGLLDLMGAIQSV